MIDEVGGSKNLLRKRNLTLKSCPNLHSIAKLALELRLRKFDAHVFVGKRSYPKSDDKINI